MNFLDSCQSKQYGSRISAVKYVKGDNYYIQTYASFKILNLIAFLEWDFMNNILSAIFS